jgi:hypothetical protein
VDFGVIHIAPEAGAIRQQMETGSLWRIRRTGLVHGEVPPRPVELPIYLLQGIALLGGIVGLGLLTGKLLRRERRNGHRRR